MNETLRVLNLVNAASFVALAGVAILRWRQRRGAARAWLAATLGILAAVSIAGRILPAEGTSTEIDLARKCLVAVLLLFPYCLYRFGATFRQPGRVTRIVSAATTAVCCALPFTFRRFPVTGQARSPEFVAYVVLIVVQWAVLSGLVAIWLWRAGAGQPTVARRRMRTLSMGAAGLALAIVISGASPSGEDASIGQVVVAALVIATGPLFLLGFSPPGSCSQRGAARRNFASVRPRPGSWRR